MKDARVGLPKATLDADQPLAGHMVALIFEKPSTRTRVSFDVGVRQMGGETMVLSGSDMQLGHGETIADTARVLSRYVDLIMIRTFDESVLLEMAEYADVPVINGLTDRTHPCQIMADVMTFEEHRGPIKGKKVVWCGDGNNVCASFLHAAAQFEFDLTVFTGPAQQLIPRTRSSGLARKAGCQRSSIERDPACGRRKARIWSSRTLGCPCTTANLPRNAATTCCAPYQVNEDADVSTPNRTRCSCIACPRTARKKSTSAVMDGPQSGDL